MNTVCNHDDRTRDCLDKDFHAVLSSLSVPFATLVVEHGLTTSVPNPMLQLSENFSKNILLA